MNKLYVLQYQDGSLVGIDYASGGYPWKAYDPKAGGSLDHVKFWASKDEANDYNNVIKDGLEVKEFHWSIR